MVVGDVPTEADVVVVGGGPGGYVAAIRAAQLGMQVVLIDPGPPGGACLHYTCIPTKALLSATEQAARLPRLAEMGIQINGSCVDWGQMLAWKEAIVDRLAKGVRQLLDGHKVEIVEGRGWFLAERELRVETAEHSLRYTFERCILAVGAEPMPLAGLPFDHERVLSAGEALRRRELPPSLAVVGSSYVAAEVATVFARLGVPVRLLLPAGTRLLGEFDPLAGRVVATQLKKMGVKVEREVADPAAAVGDAAQVVVAVGLAPRTADLRLNLPRIDTDELGFIRVDPRMRTSNERVYAVGDVNGLTTLATAAIKQAKIAAEDLAGLPVAYAPQAIPRVAWTDPPVASVGLTSAEAEAAGYTISAGRFPLAASGRALTLNAADGVALVVADKGSGVLLGATLVGAQAGDLIGEMTLALEMGATLTDIAETLHAHPGLGEALQEASEAALGAAVHLLRPV